MRFYFLLIALVSTTFTYSQSSLKLEKIMAGNEFIGHQPGQVTWSPDNKFIFFKWNKDNELITPTWSYNVETKALKKLSSKESANFPIDGFISSENKKFKCYELKNTLYKLDESNQPIPVFTFYDSFRIIKVMNSGKILIRIQDHLVMIDNESSPVFKEVGQFNSGSDPNQFSHSPGRLEKQQQELFEITRKEAAKDSLRKLQSQQVNEGRLSTFYIADRHHLGWVDLTEDEQYLIFSINYYPDNSPTKIFDYMSNDGEAKEVRARSKVGKTDPIHHLYVWNLDKDSIVQIKPDHLTGIKKVPSDYLSAKETKEYSQPKKVIYHNHGSNENQNNYLIEIKSYDNKDRWIGYIDLVNYKLIEVDHQHDEAWIGGPGISGWNMVPGSLGWIEKNTFYYQSESSGFSHLYTATCSKNGTFNKSQLTEGNYEIHEVWKSKDPEKLYVITNKNHPGNREFGTISIKDKQYTTLFEKDGNHEVYLSPDESKIAYLYSFKNQPWELFLTQKGKKKSETEQITQSLTDEFKSYNWRVPEVITFKATDGTDVYARIYQPEGNIKNGAGVIFVHGAGYLQNAHNWWSGYYREYMFNNLLCDLGYTVLDIDYRASKGYGRDFRTAIYQHMGGKDLSDHIDGRQYLIDTHQIDPNRIGIYGGSYGGFITIMALLQHPGKFKCGAAIRSVTDWEHYNHEYTSNILNIPSEDPDSYRRSSPIYFAEGLEDRLLMLHGIMDDNVQYQDVVRLSQRFIELGKKDWDLIGYPIEPHGFVETSSWVDEYGRILEMFEEELK